MWAIYKKQKNNTKIKKTEDSRYTYQNKLGKACLQNEMDYEYFKDLSRTASGKAFNIYKNPKYDRYQCEKKN